MGEGRDLARPDAPLHAAVLDDFKDQLFIVMLRRLGGKVTIPVEEADDTGGLMVMMNIEDRKFNFALKEKQ